MSYKFNTGITPEILQNFLQSFFHVMGYEFHTDFTLGIPHMASVTHLVQGSITGISEELVCSGLGQKVVAGGVQTSSVGGLVEGALAVLAGVVALLAEAVGGGGSGVVVVAEGSSLLGSERVLAKTEAGLPGVRGIGKLGVFVGE